jgi:hypothetical protein
MPAKTLLQTRVDPATAALVRYHAARANLSASEWIAAVLRRELGQAGTADALALRAYETLLTLGYMLRTLMIDTLGAEPAETAIQDASAAAEDDAAGDLERATAIP